MISPDDSFSHLELFVFMKRFDILISMFMTGQCMLPWYKDHVRILLEPVLCSCLFLSCPTNPPLSACVYCTQQAAGMILKRVPSMSGKGAGSAEVLSHVWFSCVSLSCHALENRLCRNNVVIQQSTASGTVCRSQ